jgi:hypothetical protein
MNRLVGLIFLLFLYSFNEKKDLVINTSIDSCEKYRNIKIILIKCDKKESCEFITSCIVETNRIIVPEILSNAQFKKLYESADYIKVKLLIGSSCQEQVIKL